MNFHPIITLFALLACLVPAVEARQEMLAPRPEVALVRIDFFVTKTYMRYPETHVHLQDVATRALLRLPIQRDKVRRKGFRHAAMQCYLKTGTYHLLEYKNTSGGDYVGFSIRRSFVITADDYGHEIVIAEINHGKELTVKSSRLSVME